MGKSLTSLDGEVVCFTGTLKRKRAEATKLAKSAGADVKTSVTKAVTVLVAGADAGSKVDKAGPGVKVLSEKEFDALAGDGDDNESESDDGSSEEAPKKPAKKSTKKDTLESLDGEVVCFTGTLKRKRAEATKLAKSAGAEVKTSVTKAVTVLVAGADAGSKVDKAGPGVKVLSEKEFDALAGDDDDDESESESESDSSSEEAPKKSVKKAAKPAAKKAGTKRKHEDEDDEDEDEAKAPAAKKGKKDTLESLDGEVVCFTGTLKRKRAEATKLAKSAGADVKTSVTKAVTVLVAGADAGSKVDKAGPGVKVLSEKEFDALAGDGDDNESESDDDGSSEEAPKKPAKKSTKKDTLESLDGEVVCFTGTLKRKRAEATKLALAAGAEVKGSVTKAVTVLVAGADAGSKVDKAGPGVKVLSEKEFDALAGDDDGDDNESDDDSDSSSEEAPKKSVKKAAKPAAKKSGTKRKHEDDEEDEDEAKEPAAKKTKVSGSRAVDRVFGQQAQYSVHGDWTIMLNQTNIDAGSNNNKFYKMQLLEGKNDFVLWTRWGRVGVEGQTQKAVFPNAAAGQKGFCDKFRDKTKNDYRKTVVEKSVPFNKVKGKYQLVDVVDDDGDDDAPVGKLSEEQIKKGQAVLETLRDTLESGKAKGAKLALLSSEYYSQIPTNFGFTKPPVLDTLDMVEEQEEKLKFMMRMGFDEMVLEEEDDGAETPIHGLLDLTCPKTLAETKPKGASKSDLSGSVKKADGLYKKAKAKLDASVVRAATIDPKELYGSVLLYTSNCIYRELNQSLRDMDRKAVKQGYFSYLRLLFESFTFLKSCGKENPSTLWRGVGVDLSKEYKVGSTITWWGVSSCTSAKEVAESFAGGCKDSTLLTIETTSGVDISSITYYPHEKETLLAPGTKLKVLANKKGKSFVEIRLREVSE